MNRISLWSTKRSAWLLLFSLSLSLEIAALVFQHGFGFEPCVMCIYQRNALWGIVLASTIVLISNTPWTRLFGYGLWLLSSVWGALLSWEHIDILTASNPFYIACDAMPNFPAFLPLHQWLPSMFAAPGLCNDDSWQLLGFTMPHWLLGIFSLFALTCVIVVVSRLMDARKL